MPSADTWAVPRLCGTAVGTGTQAQPGWRCRTAAQLAAWPPGWREAEPPQPTPGAGLGTRS